MVGRSLRPVAASVRAFATQWSETQAGHLNGVSAIGPSPGLVWAHGLGGSCAADDIRGVGEVINPRVLGRTVLRIDLRGHGRSATAHDPARGAEQYLWCEMAKDLRRAAHVSLSRSFFGGEAMGAAVALHAAVAATVGKAGDAPPGLVLMRPPVALVGGISGNSIADQRRQLETAAAKAAESGGFKAVEAWEASGTSLVDGIGAVYAGCDGAAQLLQEQRRTMAVEAYAAALHGSVLSEPPGKELRVLQEKRQSMAADAYGVPLTLQCPVLILAVPGDPGHSVEAAEQLAALLPGAELEVAADMQEACSVWAKRIGAFMKKAWMKEFLTKRVMPQ